MLWFTLMIFRHVKEKKIKKNLLMFLNICKQPKLFLFKYKLISLKKKS